MSNFTPTTFNNLAEMEQYVKNQAVNRGLGMRISKNEGKTDVQMTRYGKHRKEKREKRKKTKHKDKHTLRY